MDSSGGWLVCVGVVIVAASLASATIFAQFPLDHLGNRPKGRGLFEWLYNCVLDDVGVFGYDSILGALSPPLRVAVHVGSLVILWGTLLSVGPFLSSTSAGILALVGYLSLFGYWMHILPGVSMPGGPRAAKIQRKPRWEDRTSSVDAAPSSWRCAVATDSHDATHARFADGKCRLSGESAGRQIWTTVAKSAVKQVEKSSSFMDQIRNLASPKSKDTEELVQEMARGGRSYSGFNPSKNPNSCDMIFRAQQIRSYIKSGKEPPSMDTKPSTVRDAASKAMHFYSMLQTEDGHWAGDYGGPHFLMPGMVSAWYIMGKPKEFLDDDQVDLLKNYILVHQQIDGGWGTHIESPSTMFGSTLMYVTLRLLGAPAEHPACVKGRKFVQDNGGALMTSSWAKFYLCLLGCMEWEGHNSVPPEMWLLPNWFPFHPGRMWCHARMVYLPMGYLYGSRFVYGNAETDPVIQALRSEIYCQPYNSIPWMKTRHWVAPMDNYSPIPWVMKTLQNILARYEKWAVFQPLKNYVRKRGLAFSLEYMHAEDLQTNYIDIGPVNKVLNMVSAFHASGGNLADPEVTSHMLRVQDYLWIAEDGMKMQGYNGSQCWDTSFCAQAMFEADLLDEFPEVSAKIWQYLERTQILSTEVSQSSPAYTYESNEYRNKFYRHISEGGWPFSTSAHGWPISDCTAEGLKASLCLLKSKTVKRGLDEGTLNAISPERLEKAAKILLSYQNEDGGWATYENNRGWGWYEQLNPSEVFGDIMIDYSYVECSMAALTGLADFREMFPDMLAAEIEHSIEKGRAFLKSIQRPDGSWYGSWACCFTYGCWFGVEGLIRCGEPLDSPSILKACDFLLKHQRENGGWGEDFTSCYDKDYAKDGMKDYGDSGSGIVNTSWALMTLSMAECKDVDAIRRGIQYLMARQLPSGDWPQEGISGVFNRSVGITYTAYRNVFPIWAMGRCMEKYGDALEDNWVVPE